MIVADGYIVAVEAKDAQHDEVVERIAEMPSAPEGFVYKLRVADLEWELVELPPVTDPELDESEAFGIIFGGAE